MLPFIWLSFTCLCYSRSNGYIPDIPTDLFVIFAYHQWTVQSVAMYILRFAKSNLHSCTRKINSDLFFVFLTFNTESIYSLTKECTILVLLKELENLWIVRTHLAMKAKQRMCTIHERILSKDDNFRFTSWLMNGVGF